MNVESLDALWDATMLSIRLQQSGFSQDESIQIAANPASGVELAEGLDGRPVLKVPTINK